MTAALSSQHPVETEPDVSDGMSLADLDRLRRALPGCEAAMLADIATQTVLGVSAALHLPQEHHDALCRQAGLALRVGAGQSGAALLVRSTGLRLFLRAPGYPDEVLALVLPPQADIETVLGTAMAALSGQLPAEAPHDAV